MIDKIVFEVLGVVDGGGEQSDEFIGPKLILAVSRDEAKEKFIIDTLSISQGYKCAPPERRLVLVRPFCR